MTPRGATKPLPWNALAWKDQVRRPSGRTVTIGSWVPGYVEVRFDLRAAGLDVPGKRLAGMSYPFDGSKRDWMFVARRLLIDFDAVLSAQIADIAFYES